MHAMYRRQTSDKHSWNVQLDFSPPLSLLAFSWRLFQKCKFLSISSIGSLDITFLTNAWPRLSLALVRHFSQAFWSGIFSRFSNTLPFWCVWMVSNGFPSNESSEIIKSYEFVEEFEYILLHIFWESKPQLFTNFDTIVRYSPSAKSHDNTLVTANYLSCVHITSRTTIAPENRMFSRENCLIK